MTTPASSPTVWQPADRANVNYTYDGFPGCMPNRIASELLRRLDWIQQDHYIAAAPAGRLKFPLDQLKPLAESEQHGR